MFDHQSHPPLSKRILVFIVVRPLSRPPPSAPPTVVDYIARPPNYHLWTLYTAPIDALPPSETSSSTLHNICAGAWHRRVGEGERGGGPHSPIGQNHRTATTSVFETPSHRPCYPCLAHVPTYHPLNYHCCWKLCFRPPKMCHVATGATTLITQG